MSNLALSALETQPKIETKQGQYKVVTTTLNFPTTERVELRGITDEIHSFVEQSPVRDGIVHVSTLHTTTGLLLNEIEGALVSDMTTLFEQLVPRAVYYKHNDPLLTGCARKNADAHLRAMVVGHSLSIPVEDGKLRLGTWQRVLLAEFDGPNTRKVHLQVMGI
jgi:secondary thiamine-phosphate synthase enzyme